MKTTKNSCSKCAVSKKVRNPLIFHISDVQIGNNQFDTRVGLELLHGFGKPLRCLQVFVHTSHNVHAHRGARIMLDLYAGLPPIPEKNISPTCAPEWFFWRAWICQSLVSGNCGHTSPLASVTL